MKPRPEHVVFDGNTNEMHCQHCGERYKVNLPVPMVLFADMCKSYARIHRGCKAQKLEREKQ